MHAQVLIFSQFKIMLDVLEDYLRMSEMPLERIDGSVAQRDRQVAIDRFSKGENLHWDRPSSKPMTEESREPPCMLASSCPYCNAGVLAALIEQQLVLASSVAAAPLDEVTQPSH